MKKFLKNNWWLIVGFIISFALIFLGALFLICFIIGLILIGVLLIIISSKVKNKFETFKENLKGEEENYFDATLYDYDEDVYYFDTKPKLKNQIKTSLFANFSSRMPSLIICLFGVGIIIFAITMSIKLFF